MPQKIPDFEIRNEQLSRSLNHQTSSELFISDPINLFVALATICRSFITSKVNTTSINKKIYHKLVVSHVNLSSIEVGNTVETK
jgi:hypothetical protein